MQKKICSLFSLSTLLEGIHASQAATVTSTAPPAPVSTSFTGGRAPGSSLHGFPNEFDDVSGLHDKVR